MESVQIPTSVINLTEQCKVRNISNVGGRYVQCPGMAEKSLKTEATIDMDD